MKRKQWPNDWVKKNMDMDMHSKPAAQERAIPENDKMENEKLENMEFWMECMHGIMDLD